MLVLADILYNILQWCTEIHNPERRSIFSRIGTKIGPINKEFLQDMMEIEEEIEEDLSSQG